MIEKLSKRYTKIATILGITGYILASGACSKEDAPPPKIEEPKPTAIFEHEQIAANDPFSYAFTNKGTNYSLVRWEFGDDSVSLDDSPSHTFLRTGDYRVTLHTENSEGFWAKSETVINIRPDSLMEIAVSPKADGSIDLTVDSDMEIDSVFWYKGVGVGGEFLGNDELLNIAVGTGKFENYTLRIKTPNGSVSEISRLLTDLGIVRDMTDQHGQFTVSRDNDGGKFAGEGSLKLIDNNPETKFLQGGFAGDLWWQLEYYEPVILGGYTFRSANDAPNRDPKNWRVEGSLDGQNWVLLDERTDEVFESRFLTKTYTFENSTAYHFYRVSVTAVVSGGLFQLAEWRVLQMPQ
ncbi:PKD domain-containing protein [Parapedobacter deserti]|uniref:PKD domain-containing protein n=1 Tax=Parapedobacter deserti TaxID=1912957 RepID=A0ABV7JDK8_9SPHI